MEWTEDKPRVRKLRVGVFADRFYGSFVENDYSLKGNIAWLIARLDEVPAEYRDSAVIDIHGDDSAVDLEIYYERPETDGERAERKRYEEDEARRRYERAERNLRIAQREMDGFRRPTPEHIVPDEAKLEVSDVRDGK